VEGHMTKAKSSSLSTHESSRNRVNFQ